VGDHLSSAAGACARAAAVILERTHREQRRSDCQLLKDLLLRLVDDPSAVEVRVVPGSPALRGHRRPRGHRQVVGREGRIVKSIRSLVAAAAQKRGEYATFEIVDPQG
jgi:predicted RNA-binding protein YlqC (UPF0109 family)